MNGKNWDLKNFRTMTILEKIDKYLNEAKIKDKSQEWRGGFVEEWSEPMKGWIRAEAITVKPGQSIKQLEKQLSRDRKTKVRISIYKV